MEATANVGVGVGVGVGVTGAASVPGQEAIPPLRPPSRAKSFISDDLIRPRPSELTKLS